MDVLTVVLGGCLASVLMEQWEEKLEKSAIYNSYYPPKRMNGRSRLRAYSLKK